MLTRRDVLKQTGMVAALATTAPWWLVRRAHAARSEKLIVWSPSPWRRRSISSSRTRHYAYAKQAGIKENELQYVEVGTGQWLPKMVAALEAGIPPDVTRYSQAQAALFRAQGHLIEVTDIVEKMQQVPGGLFDASLNAVMYKGKAYSVPQPSAPRPWSRAWIFSRPPRSIPPRRGMSSSRCARSCKSPPSSPASVCAWGSTRIPTAT